MSYPSVQCKETPVNPLGGLLWRLSHRGAFRRAQSREPPFLVYARTCLRARCRIRAVWHSNGWGTIVWACEVALRGFCDGTHFRVQQCRCASTPHDLGA
eukprot:6180067-Pleurochrysis_carterae.AAC.2